LPVINGVNSFYQVKAKKFIAHAEEPVIELDGPAKQLRLLKGADTLRQSVDTTDMSQTFADGVGYRVQTKDSAGGWKPRLTISGGVDVAEERTENAVKKIIPPSPGADALIVRDAADTKNMLQITENRMTLQTPGGVGIQYIGDDGVTRRIAYPRQGYPNQLMFTDWVTAHFNEIYMYGGISEIFWASFRAGYGISTDESADAAVYFRSHNGTTYVNTARLLGGYIEIARGKLTGNVVMKPFDAGTTVSINAGSTYTLPNGAWYVNLGANTKAQVYDDVAAAWVDTISVGGKGIVISDGTNARLYNTGTSAESSNMRRVF
jgi:hypothetical protein